MKNNIRPALGQPLQKLLLTAAALSSSALFAQTPDDEVRLLREQLASIQARLDALESAPVPRDSAGGNRGDDPVITAGPGGFSLTSADKRYQLRIRGNIHADGRFYFGDTSGTDTFLLRRVRPIIQGTVAEKFGFRIMPDFAGSSVTLLDANATYSHSPAFNVLIGKAKSPFDLERLVSQTDLLFIERAYPTTLGPNRDVGLQLYGDLFEQRLSYQVAVGNGVRDNDSSVADVNNDKDFTARIFAHPFKGSGGFLEGLGVGLALSHGERSGTPNGYRTLAQQTFFSWRQNVEADGDNTRVSPQFHYYNGPFGVMGSWVSSRHQIALGPERTKITQEAWFLAVQWVLTGEDAGSRGVRPRQDFNWANRTWGAWEIAARYSELDIDDDVFPVFADPANSASKVGSYTLGVNWYLNRNVKLALNFEHSDFTGGPSGPVSRRDENAIFSRAQISF